MSERKVRPINMKRLAVQRNEHYEGLGRFIDRYSHTEGFIAIHLWMLCGISMDIGYVVLAGESIDSAVGYIRAICKRKKLSPEAEKHLSIGLDKLQKINVLRNTLIHYGSLFNGHDDPATTTSWLKSDNPNRVVYKLPPDSFFNLCQDLDKLEAHISVALLEVIPSHITGGDLFDSHLQRAWLYKFPEQQKKDRSRRISPAQRRQRKSSPD